MAFSIMQQEVVIMALVQMLSLVISTFMLMIFLLLTPIPSWIFLTLLAFSNMLTSLLTILDTLLTFLFLVLPLTSFIMSLALFPPCPTTLPFLPVLLSRPKTYQYVPPKRLGP